MHCVATFSRRNSVLVRFTHATPARTQCHLLLTTHKISPVRPPCRPPQPRSSHPSSSSSFSLPSSLCNTRSPFALPLLRQSASLRAHPKRPRRHLHRRRGLQNPSLHPTNDWVVDIGAAASSLESIIADYNMKNLDDIFPDEATTTEFMARTNSSDRGCKTFALKGEYVPLYTSRIKLGRRLRTM